jgi:hypothetical protein
MDDVFTPADAMRADYFYEFHEVGNTDPSTPLAQVTKRAPIPHLDTGTIVVLGVNGGSGRYIVERVELDLWSGDDSSVYFEVYVTQG